MVIRHLFATVAIAITTSVGFNLMSVTQVSFSPAAIAQRPRVGSVDGSRPAGRRGGCPANLTAVQTLLFQNQTGKTVSDRPLFLWHLSKAAPVNVRFRLLDAEGTPVHVEMFTKPGAGFHPVKLPQGIKLQQDQEYTWAIAVLCDPASASKNPTAFGRITRVAAPADLTAQLTAAKTPQARAEVYASQALWYDALTVLWEAYMVKPNDTVTWQQVLSLLEQMGHRDVVEQEQAHPIGNTGGTHPLLSPPSR